MSQTASREALRLLPVAEPRTPIRRARGGAEVAPTPGVMMALAAPFETPDAPRVIADKYRLESLLSEGGMGSVWRAFNLQLEVPVAIKLLRPGLSGDEPGERLRVEARAAA